MLDEKPLNTFINEFKIKNPNSTIIFVYKAGSHFFDLESSNSDTDFRGVYLPSPDDFFFKNTKKIFNVLEFSTNRKERNNSSDVDLSLVSLPKFLELIRDGDFNMMEALYCPDNKIILDTPLMKELRDNKDRLTIINAYSFLGFFKKEYMRYDVNPKIKTNRIIFNTFLKSLNNSSERIGNYVDELVKFNILNSDIITIGNESIKIGLSEFNLNHKVSYVINKLDRDAALSGKKLDALINIGKEFKGMYHAQRLLFEARELLTNNRLVFPFPKEQHDYLRKIKDGNIDRNELFRRVELDYNELLLMNKKISQKSNERFDKIIETLKSKMEIHYITNIKK